MEHEKTIRKILSNTLNGYIKSRESNTVEFKESYHKSNAPKYAKIMASFSNNRGGYIIFGITDKQRRVKGLSNNSFENLSQEGFTDVLNSLFSPSIEWECGVMDVDIVRCVENKDDIDIEKKKIGWIYAYETEHKPVIATKAVDGERITSGDIYYRYRARTEKIKYAEMVQIIEKRVAKEREILFKLFDTLKNNNIASLGIVNYSAGKFTTPYGVDVAFDQKLVAKVLRKAKFIKEGSFNEIEGKPVIKVTGNIDLAEEVPVPEGNPDETHPYIQKQLHELTGIPLTDLYALIWYYHMKEAKKYHLEITTSKSGKTHKFSNFALQFLKEKYSELQGDLTELENIRNAYKKRNLV